MKLSKSYRRGDVAGNGMVPSQPGTSVSVSSPAYDKHYNVIGGAELHVFRYYQNLRNEFGGHGKFKNCDCYGMIFPTTDEAFAYAAERGYTQEYFTSPDLRARRLAQATAKRAN